jgi:adenine deaminase
MTPAHPAPECALVNGRLLNVLTGELTATNVLVGGGIVLGVGDRYQAAPIVYDLNGGVILPGLIDAHLHIESSLLTPSRLAEAVAPRGTTTIVADPHEIANVLGLDGVRWMLDASRGLPVECLFMAPSSVPASPLETSGARLGPDAVETMLGWERVIGLAEVMDFPGVIAGRADVVEKIRIARRLARPIDGHAPQLTGDGLEQYLSAGIESDHECISLDEAREKLRLGMRVMIREGSQAKNLQTLLPAVGAATVRRCMLVSDDRNAFDLWHDGHVDALLRQAVGAGLPPAWAVSMVTLNAAEHFGLRHVGAVAPGFSADLAVVDDLKDFHCRMTFKSGRLVARDGKLVADLPSTPASRTHMLTGPITTATFRIEGRAGPVRAIAFIPDQLETETLLVPTVVGRGALWADPAADLAKVVVIERHHGTGRVGRGFVRGLGLKHGALASSVAHDSHNLVVVGVDDEDMVTAARDVANQGGGLAIAAGGRIRAGLSLPVAGLMCDRSCADVASALEALEREAGTLGVDVRHPFGAISFLALSVIPKLRVTDQGIVDVEAGTIVPLQAD